MKKINNEWTEVLGSLHTVVGLRIRHCFRFSQKNLWKGFCLALADRDKYNHWKLLTVPNKGLSCPGERSHQNFVPPTQEDIPLSAVHVIRKRPHLYLVAIAIEPYPVFCDKQAFCRGPSIKSSKSVGETNNKKQEH